MTIDGGSPGFLILQLGSLLCGAPHLTPTPENGPQALSPDASFSYTLYLTEDLLKVPSSTRPSSSHPHGFRHTLSNVLFI